MESQLKKRNKTRKSRIYRVRKSVRGSSQKPRLTVFKSNKHLFAQVIDDEARKTLFSVGTYGKKNEKKSLSVAVSLGAELAKEAKKKKIEKVVFDRGRYKYHGLIAKLADSARENGLQF